MKKVFAVIISLLLIVSLAACGQANEPKNTETAAQETEADNAAAGAYSDASSPVITKELKAVFDKATELRGKRQRTSQVKTLRWSVLRGSVDRRCDRR